MKPNDRLGPTCLSPGASGLFILLSHKVEQPIKPIQQPILFGGFTAQSAHCKKLDKDYGLKMKA